MSINKGDPLPDDLITGAIYDLSEEDKGPTNLTVVKRPEVTNLGEYESVVEVKFKDGSKKEVNVPVLVKEAAYVPETIHIQDGTILTNEDAKSGITSLPEGAAIVLIDNTKPGKQTAKVKITFEDGSSRIVDVTFIVKEKPATPTPQPTTPQPTVSTSRPATGDSGMETEAMTLLAGLLYTVKKKEEDEE